MNQRSPTEAVLSDPKGAALRRRVHEERREIIMTNNKTFLEVPRQEAGYRPLHDRIHDFGEVEQTLNSRDRRQQASRCMDCGVPFCHWACPLGNKPPEWNAALSQGEWETAWQLLTATNPFPEFTGRVCPALCEKACVLNRYNHQPTTNRENEAAIAEGAFREGFVTSPVVQKNSLHVAVIGSGPAGLAAADALAKRGYNVTVYEKDEAAGGLLRYGIPNFKLNKAIIDRRISLMQSQGITFCYGMEVSPDAESLRHYDAIILATGTPTARDLSVPGRALSGVHLALELLSQQNRVLAGAEIAKAQRITAAGKDVIVIGGGDTGSDCIGTVHRQGCRSVTQVEIMPKPVEGPDDPQNPWPAYPRTLKTTSSHEEGCTRLWNINTLEFIGADGKLQGVKVQEIEWLPNPEGGRPLMKEKGKPRVIKAELALLAMGFLRPQHPTYPDNVFVCGDAAHGPSLVVRAMASGLQAAQAAHQWLSQSR